MNTLRLAKYNFTLRFDADATLPPFVGNTIRGAIGSALCGLGSPAYGGAFKVEAAESVPNPYAISVPFAPETHYKSGETLGFALTLFGKACDYGEAFIAAANNMCNGRLENCALDSCELEFDRVWSDAGAESIPPADAITVSFVTPTEIQNSRPLITELTFEMFIDSLFGRIGNIIDNYTDGEFVLPYALIMRKPLVAAEYSLKPAIFKTNGQPINGFLGNVTYIGSVTRYLPYIDLGSQLHIGKKTTRACGEYRLFLGGRA
jgi:hypothetical protein